MAGRSLGRFSVAMSIFATWFAAETVIATSAEVAGDGLAGARVEPFGYSLGIIVLALIVAFRLRAEGHITIAGYLGARFGPKVEVLSAVIVACSATVWAAAQLGGLASVLAEASGAPFLVTLVAGTGIVLVYTWVGGLKGDVVTDIVQGGVIVAGLIVVLVMVLKTAGGVWPALEAIPDGALAMRKEGETWFQRLELWSLPILGTIVSQEAVSRVLAARTPAVARDGALAGAGIYLVAGMIPVLLGLVAPGLDIPLAEGDAFFTSLARAVLPGWAFVVVSGALISAILSSVDSALLAVSAVATESGLRKIRPDAGPQARLRMARLATVSAGIVAGIIAGSGESIRELVLTGAGIVGILVVPLLAGILGRRQPNTSVLIAILVSFGVLVSLDWVRGLEGAFLIALAAGGWTYLVLSTIGNLFSGSKPLQGSPAGQEAPSGRRDAD